MARMLWLIMGAGLLMSCQSRNGSVAQSQVSSATPEDYSATYGESQTSSYPYEGDYVEVEPAAGETTSYYQPPAYQEEPGGGSMREPGWTESVPASSTPVTGGPANYYTVARGDTLYSIGRRYGQSIDSLKAANGLTSDLIYPGDVLSIPRS